MRFGAYIWAAVAVTLSGEAHAADAVFDAEYWQSASDIERYEDLDACADTFANLRRSIRSTAANSLVAYELRVGDVADVGDYELWARLRMPENATRTLLVGQDVGGSFNEPADRFVVTSGAGESGYRWLRVTRQGSGSADEPEFDPWLISLTQSASDLELRLVDDDVLIDRFAVSNASVYSPPSCPPYSEDDGGRVPGDGDRFSGAREAGCSSEQYFDFSTGQCVTPTERGCAAAPGGGLASLMLLLLWRRRRSEFSMPPPELC